MGSLTNSIKNKLKKFGNDYNKACEKNTRLESIVPIVLTCSFAFIVMAAAKAATTEDTLTIATNKAEVAYYASDYDKAISEYAILQENEEWPMWQVKTAEMHSIKGEFLKSNTLLEDAYEKRVTLIDRYGYGKYVEQDVELANNIVFISLMNGEKEKALEYGELMLKDNGANKDLYRTMVAVYVLNDKKDKAKELIEEYPIDKKSSYDMAIAAYLNLMVNRWDEGLAILDDAWTLNKDEVKVFDVISQVAAYDNDLILEKLTTLSKKNQGKLSYKMFLAKVYSMRVESAPQAESILNELNGQDIGKVNYKIIKAKVLQNIGQTDEATKLTETIIDDEKNSFLGYHLAAWNAFENAEYKKAFELCEKSILENKDYPDNYGFLIPEIMIKQKQDKVAEPYLWMAMSKEPFNYNIMLKIADYYWYTTKDMTKAYEYFNMAAKLKPNDADIIYNIALLEISRGNVKEAEENLKKCIKINGSNTKYYRTLGTLHLNNNNKEDGIKAIREAYAVDQTDILTLNNAGIYYITFSDELERGYINLKAAYDGLKESTDKEVRDTITSNYTKAKEVYDKYKQEDGSEIKVPDFTLFY